MEPLLGDDYVSRSMWPKPPPGDSPLSSRVSPGLESRISLHDEQCVRL